MMSSILVDTWRTIIVGEPKPWVLFGHGTCVVLTEPEPDLAAQATALMKQWGPVHVGSSAGDFATITLSDYPGWVVTGHHSDLLNYVSPDEIEGQEASDFIVGMIGRSKRDRDAKDLQIIHIEDPHDAV